MNLTVSTCFIAVDDHEKALALYRDVLGLDVRAGAFRDPSGTLLRFNQKK